MARGQTECSPIFRRMEIGERPVCPQFSCMGEEGCHRLRCARRGARASFLPGPLNKDLAEATERQMAHMLIFVEFTTTEDAPAVRAKMGYAKYPFTCPRLTDLRKIRGLKDIK